MGVIIAETEVDEVQNIENKEPELSLSGVMNYLKAKFNQMEMSNKQI